MDPFHQRLARVALEAAAGYGFCLAGGYAVQAHGFVERISKGEVPPVCRRLRYLDGSGLD
jgi:hypothetical protein